MNRETELAIKRRQLALIDAEIASLRDLREGISRLNAKLDATRAEHEALRAEVTDLLEAGRRDESSQGQ